MFYIFYVRGRRRLFQFNCILFTQEIPVEIILLCMDYDVPLRLEKTGSCKKWVISLLNFGVLVFLYKLLKKLRKYYSKFIWFPGKNIDIQSFSIQLYEIVIDYLFNVTQSNIRVTCGRLSTKWKILGMLSFFWRTTCPGWCGASL